MPLSGAGNRNWDWFPSIAADIYGGIHVVWNSAGSPKEFAASEKTTGRPADDAGWLMYTQWDGRRWTGPNEIGATGFKGDALRSAIASDNSGRLHIVYRGLDLSAPKVLAAEQEPQRYSGADIVQAEGASAWSPGVALSTRVPAYFSDIAADSTGSLHAVWTEFDQQTGYGVYYRRSMDGGQSWSPATVIEGDRTVSRWRLQLKVGPRDELHLVYEVVDPADPSSRTPLGFVYAHSKDGGTSWSKKSFVPARNFGTYDTSFDGAGWRVQPAVGFDRRGQILLVWRDAGNNLIYSQRSEDGERWSRPELVPGIGRGIARPFDRYDMATDSAGRVHLVEVGYPTGSTTLALLHSEWNGYGWSPPDAIFIANDAPYPEWPRIAITGGNRLHVVWFGRDSDDASGNPIGIWYSAAQTDAPVVPPAPRPAPAPTASETRVQPTVVAAIPEAAEIAQPPSSAQPDDVSPMGTDASPTLDAAGALALSLAAVLALLGAAYALRRLRVTA